MSVSKIVMLLITDITSQWLFPNNKHQTQLTSHSSNVTMLRMTLYTEHLVFTITTCSHIAKLYIPYCHWTGCLSYTIFKNDLQCVYRTKLTSCNDDTLVCSAPADTRDSALVSGHVSSWCHQTRVSVQSPCSDTTILSSWYQVHLSVE